MTTKKKKKSNPKTNLPIKQQYLTQQINNNQ